MAWIESHQSLGRHPKLFKLAGLLGIDKAQAVGHLHYLWWWALQYASSGDLSIFNNGEIAIAAEWPGDSKAFYGSLKESSWLDPDGKLHDWLDYAGQWLGAVARMKRYRANGGASPGWPKLRLEILTRDKNICGYCGARAYVVGHILPLSGGGTSDPSNLIASCKQCNWKRGDKTIEQAGMQRICNATEMANLTKPNQTIPIGKEGVRFQRPTPQEVEVYAKTQNCHINGQQFCDYYEASGWRRGNTPIKSWKACVRTWKSREPAKAQTYGISPATAATNAKEAQERSKLMALEVELKADLDRIKALPKERQSEIRVRATKLIPPDMKYGIESILMPQAMVDAWREMGRPS